MSRARVTVAALGGTIAMVEREQSAGVVPVLDGPALVAAVPELAEVADVRAETFRQLPGAHLSCEDVLALCDHLGAGDADGCVVTQGTDTLEETAFLADLLWTEDRPLVFTGAMRHPASAGADGPANLAAAVRVASNPASRGRGVLVVMHDEVHTARTVRKTHTSSPGAFTSPQAGPVGSVVEGRVRLWSPPSARQRLPAPSGPAPDVALVRVALGDRGTRVRALAGEDVTGVVVEAMGGGHVPAPVADALGELAARMPVVLASRTGAGAVLRDTYGFPGSERDLLARGLVPAGLLDGLKARLLLLVLCWAGAGLDDVREAFAFWDAAA